LIPEEDGMPLDTIQNGAAWLAAGAALSTLVTYFLARRSAPTATLGSDGPAEDPAMTFLFQGEQLLDATAAARAFLGDVENGETACTRLVDRLRSDFPGLEKALETLSEIKRVDLAAPNGAGRIEAEWLGGRTCLRLFRAPDGETLKPIDGHALAALLREVTDLRGVASGVTVPVWRANRRGEVIWANRAYLDLAHLLRSEEEEASWPLPVLFPGISELVPTPAGGRRVELHPHADAEALWFRVDAAPCEEGTVFTAIPEDAAVRSEAALRGFVQTLSNTFAHLTAGLAVFDGGRQLTVFNPALTELTGLPVDYLTARPGFEDFLDRLRDQRITPEPRDYRSWKSELADLERAAADGTYSEHWPLADGRTFRVNGRPHVDGGLALVFEDITSEVSLTRRFRAELETGQAVLDRMSEAVAVFSPAGILSMANRAYSELWHCDPMEKLGGNATFLEATRTWHKACIPSPVWGDARDFAAGFNERAEWRAEVQHRDGRRLACRFEPLPGGDTLVGFTVLEEKQTAGTQTAQTALRA
jgi:PAS domain-containing protein